MTKKILIWLVATFFLANPPVEAAQQPTKIPRIGFLISGNTPTSTSLGPNLEAFHQGLRDLGYIVGKNIVIEYRGAGGKLERMPGLVAELIGLGVNVIVTSGMPAIFVDKIVKGNKPADLPVEKPLKFDFIVNLKATKQIGLTIPPNVLVRANKVIR